MEHADRKPAARCGIAVIGLFIAFAGLTGCGGADPEAAAAHVTRARQMLEKRDHVSAVIELKNALQANPDSAEVRQLLGQSYLAQGQGNAALKELEAAERLGAPAAQLEPQLLQALLMSRKLEEVLSRTSAPDLDAERLGLRASALHALDRRDEARTALTRALEMDPQSAGTLIGLASLAVEDKALDDARDYLSRASAAHPDDERVWLLTGEVELQRDDGAAAEAAFRKALALADGNPFGMSGLARALLQQNRLDEAMEVARSLNGLLPNHPAGRYLVAYTQYRRGDVNGARDALRALLTKAPNHGPTQLLLASILFAEGQMGQAEELVSVYLARNSANPFATKLLANTQLARSQPDAALETLQPLRSETMVDPDLLSLLADAYLRKGDFTQGNRLLEQAAENSPAPGALKTRLAMSRLAAGDSKRALADLEKLAGEAKDVTQADIGLLQTLLQRQEYDRVLTLADDLERKLPAGPFVDNLRGSVYGMKGDDAKAREYFEKALATNPKFAPALLNLANMAIEARKPDDARQLLGRILAIDPVHPEAVVLLANLELDAGNLDAARDRLVEYRKKAPDNPAAALSLARVFLRKGSSEAALEVAEVASRAAGPVPAVQAVLGEAYLAVGRRADALSVLTAAADADVSDNRLAVNIGNNLLRAGELDAAEKVANRVLTRDPDDQAGQVLAVRVALAAGDATRAQSLASGLLAAFPEVAETQGLWGDARAAGGHWQEAVEAYRKAFKLAPSTTAVVRLHDALWRTDQRDAADVLIADWLERNPGDIAARLVQGSTFARSGRDDAAIQAYELVLRTDPKNMIALNNLAQLVVRSNPDRAVKLAEQVYALYPSELAVQDTAGWVLVQAGKVEAGLELLELAFKGANRLSEADRATIQYHVAIAHLKLGDSRSAQREFEKILRTGAEFPERSDAERLLRDLTSSAP